MTASIELSIEGLSRIGSDPSRNLRVDLERRVSTSHPPSRDAFPEFSTMLQDQVLAPSRAPALVKKFVVHSDQLKSAARAISLPSRSSGVIAMTLSADALRLSESTSDNGFSVATTVDLIRSNLADNETIGFEIQKKVLASWSHHYDCELSFELDKDEDGLAWKGSARSFHIRTPVRFVDATAGTEEPRRLAEVNARALYDAIGYAALLIEKRTTGTQAFDGLQISGGGARSGYLGGVSLYRSAALPNDLSCILPKRNVSNALVAIGKMQGAVAIAETDDAVFINSGSTELFWTKAGRFRPFDGIFDTVMAATFNVVVAEALRIATIARIASDRGRIVLQASDSDHSLLLLSISPTSRYEGTLKGELRECSLPPASSLELNVDLADLHRVLLSIRTPDAEISISKHRLIVKSACADYVETSALAAVQ
ncbi:hypothetical protein JQ614_32260 [Bradyrhizobium diazoefficiens]|uniref:hypothetical protein n=1 Tax=Bradyrhizobium diazoefficiens TaxID=1355477 RepID=UPI001B8AD0AF|nr:hypothetical protein [Bradyrhizobium diazoefficiens]MBR0866303.1 hypothetical protein [Bradyrhizobium diazoefficiens]MBR0890764.1 hypothetical protein [Bradyrhizobium diazoefficiens]MBR0922597.1 hypothetical protein [Bradyrhizobium diazoefficiens]